MSEEKKESTLQRLQKEYTEDMKINFDDPIKFGMETVNGPSLNAKYSKYLSSFQMKRREYSQKKDQLSLWLEGYYKEGAYLEELKRRAHNKIPRTNDERDKMVMVDPEMVDINNKIAEIDIIIEFIYNALNYIRYNRTKDISNRIEWVKLYGGSF